MGNTWGIIQKGHDIEISNSDMAVSAFVAEF